MSFKIWKLFEEHFSSNFYHLIICPHLFLTNLLILIRSEYEKQHSYSPLNTQFIHFISFLKKFTDIGNIASDVNMGLLSDLICKKSLILLKKCFTGSLTKILLFLFSFSSTQLIRRHYQFSKIIIIKP